MGMSKMLVDPRFCFYLETLDENWTKIVNESYYKPANLMVKIMNALVMCCQKGGRKSTALFLFHFTELANVFLPEKQETKRNINASHEDAP